MIDNKGFLQTIFGDDSQFAHVTDFADDPLAIPQDRRDICWGGDYFYKYRFRGIKNNQYFCISIFKLDSAGKARRQKGLFLRCPLIVLDDVKEKLTMTEVSKLPLPTYILETSPGSEQWGYVLDTPCQVRNVVDNLLDGLVANGLAPGGDDPGMKSVTRYIRLPEGYNTKTSKMVNGEPFKCRLVSWEPQNRVSIQQLAQPFNVDLNATRRITHTSEGSNVPDHPFLHVGFNITRVKGHGKFDITCPWIDEHTEEDDSGCTIWTNEDGSPGFHCHHGHCQNRTANDLFKLLELKHPGFETKYQNWLVQHRFKDVLSSPPAESVFESVQEEDTQIGLVLSKLRKMGPTTEVARKTVSDVLQLVDKLSEIDKQHYHTEICDMMSWTKAEFSKILKDLRKGWYKKEKSSVNFYDEYVFICDKDRFYNRRTMVFMKTSAFRNAHCHQEKDCLIEALENEKVEKVDKLDFAPRQDLTYVRDNILYANTWRAVEEKMGRPGDCSIWLRHWAILGWEDHQKHMLQWMAHTLLHPDIKINHILVLGGVEGIGKDLLLTPLRKAMGRYFTERDGIRLLSDHNGYMLNTKYLHINETELGDHKKADTIRAKIKPLGAAPPDTISVNPKGVDDFDISNIANVTMTTNSQRPFKLEGASRRFYAVWSDHNPRGLDNQHTESSRGYFKQSWDWMYTSSAIDHCIYYLRNHVDLSDFDPKAPPPVTEFLQEIQESSKSAGQQTLEAFIANDIGIFGDDLISATDASETLRSGLVANEKFMYAQGTWFTPQKVGAILKDIPGCARLRAKGEQEIRIWAIRNKERYERMGMGERYQRFISKRR